jgi:hypothetical protein
MKYLFRKIKNSLYAIVVILLLLDWLSFLALNNVTEQAIANTDQVECLEEAIILLQKKEIERLEKDLEECKDKRQVDCVYRESL